MVPLALGVTFIGYGVLYFGLCMVMGKTAGLSTVLVPGKYKGTKSTTTESTPTGKSPKPGQPGSKTNPTTTGSIIPPIFG